jgi:hypothetical protein
MTLWKWVDGRQGSGYHKLLLACIAPYFDVYLLRFPEDSFVPIHKDPVTNRRHFRLNIVLRRAKFGGKMVCEAGLGISSRVMYFRPDVVKHALTRVQAGTLYMLSIGWTRR